ncbi:MAG: hypothetical protein ACHQTE_01660 [Candidatus Saccharimonadales bacterium]
MMNRERQILQDINKEDSRIIKFSETEAVSRLEFNKEELQVEVPARIEGRSHQKTIVVKHLAQIATYASLSEFFADKPEQTDSYYDTRWTTSDMPDDVLERHAAWSGQDNVPTEVAVRDVLHKEATATLDRMTEKHVCLDCSAGTQWACRTSGWSRELYRYPLIQVKDITSGQIYEVPFDVALYVDQHPERLQYGSRARFDKDGSMSAYYCAALSGDTVSGDYIRLATNSAIDPQAEQLEIIPSGVAMSDIVVYMGGWQENGFNTYMDSYTPEKVARCLQDAAMKQHAERVSDLNYNELFDALRRKLGTRGLSLAFRYVYMGMGDSDAEFRVLDSKNETLSSLHSIDAYEALIELNDKIIFESE